MYKQKKEAEAITKGKTRGYN